MSSLIYELLVSGRIYLYLYILLYIYALVDLSRVSIDTQKVLFYVSFIVLFLFLSCRWETGTDWDAYKELFDDIKLDWNFILNVYSFDIGYVLLNAFVRFFTDSYTLFLFVDSFIALGILFFLLKRYTSYPNVAVFYFYVCFYLSHYVGSNRRMIAMSALLYAFYYVYKGDKKRFLFWQILAFAFHRSSIVGLFAWFIPKKLLSKKKILIILSISLCLGVFQIPFKLIDYCSNMLVGIINHPIVEKMNYYSETNLDNVSENLNPAIQTFLSIVKRSICLIFYLYLIRSYKGKIDSFTSYIFNLYIFSFSFYVLLTGSPIFQVLSAFFALVEIVLLGRILFYSSYYAKCLLASYLFFLGLFQLLSALNAYPELYIPYIPFWSEVHRL